MKQLANSDRSLIRDSSAVVTVHAVDLLAEIAQETRQYLDADDRDAITARYWRSRNRSTISAQPFVYVA